MRLFPFSAAVFSVFSWGHPAFAQAPKNFEPAPEAEPVFDAEPAPEVQVPAPPEPSPPVEPVREPTPLEPHRPAREPLWIDPPIPRLAPAYVQACPSRPAVSPPQVSPTSPADADTSADWLRLQSGEWLKGTINRLREGALDFTSTSVGNQTLGWDSVVELRSSRRLIYVHSDRSTAVGPARLQDGRLTVQQTSGPRSMSQREVLSIVPEKTAELSKWAFRATLGVGARLGNTSSIDYLSFARLSRVDAYSRIVSEYNGAYGTVSDTENTNKHRGNSGWDLFVSPAFYVTPLSGEAVYDRFQNLALRWTLATGFGARALRLAAFTMKTDLGFGFLQNNYNSVEAGQPRTTQGAFARPGIQINGALAGNLAFEVQWQSSIVVTNLPYTFHHGAARLSVGLVGILSLDLSAVYDRQETTVTGADGVTPRRDDIAMALGFGIDLH